MKISIIKYILFYLGCYTLSVSCICIKHRSSLRGIYHDNDGTGLKLILDKKNFYYVESSSYHLPVYLCCDTLALGTWDFDNNNMITLSSPDTLGSKDIGFTNIFVTEQNAYESEKKLDFFISNPIEKFHDNMEMVNG